MPATCSWWRLFQLRHGRSFPHWLWLGPGYRRVLNYIISPAGNPYFLFGESSWFAARFLLMPWLITDSPRQEDREKRDCPEPDVRSCGGYLLPFVAKAMKGGGHLGPYAVDFVFALGPHLQLSHQLWFMRRPVTEHPLDQRIFPGRAYLHAGSSW